MIPPTLLNAQLCSGVATVPPCALPRPLRAQSTGIVVMTATDGYGQKRTTHWGGREEQHHDRASGPVTPSTSMLKVRCSICRFLLVCFVMVGIVWNQDVPAAQILGNTRNQLSTSTIGRCSGSAMACEAPGETDRTPVEPSDEDDEHALLHELLSVIDNNFYDLRNEEGAAASSVSHTYNGKSIDDVRGEKDSRKLKSRGATHQEMRRVVSSLGDKYSRFLTPSEASYLRKYDVSGCGLLLIRQVCPARQV